MTIRYIGSGGSDANSGLSWALRKLTLNGVEDTPVVAGDFVWVGPGTYRELLTIDVSGTAGNPITYAGDYTGANTDGVGGVVRITGSNDDITAARATWITATSKDYRTFQGFTGDIVSSTGISLITACSNWIIDKCSLSGMTGSSALVSFAGTGTTNTLQNCLLIPSANVFGLNLTHSATVSAAGHLIQNCIFLGGDTSINTTRVGGVTVKNCAFVASRVRGISVGTALAVGQAITVNNCIFNNCTTAVGATVTTEIVENYNTFWGCTTNRTNTDIGANSVVYPPLFDPRWFFQLLYAGAGPSSPLQVVSLFDLASYSQLVNLAGTSPAATGLRGTAIIGAQREWGPLEYDSTLKLTGGIKKSRLFTGGM